MLCTEEIHLSTETPSSSDAAGDTVSISNNIALQLIMQNARAKRASGSGMSEVAREIRIYHDSLSPDLAGAVDPISFWDSHLFARNPAYNILPGIALDILAIPATTAPVERVFSHAGCALGLRRLRLTDVNLEREVMMRFNKRFMPPV